MMFKKIIVIGCPGSGKSTFCRKLRDITKLPLYYLDMIWHRPDGTHVSREDFDKRLGEILSKDSWIIDGNYQRTLRVRLKKCDTVFLFDLPVQVCIDSARTRIGSRREDMPWVETEFDEEFKRSILSFETDNLPDIYKMLKEHTDKRIVIFKSRQQADEYLDNLKGKGI